MLLVGLTGGIASGKSTVAKMFEELGAQVIDLDVLSRKVVEPGSQALWEIRKRFGDGVINPDGTLNRKALGEIVFREKDARRALEGIIHPRVLREMWSMVRNIAKRAPNAVVVVDVPLLLELKMQDMFHEVVLVYAPRYLQKMRLIQREGLDEDQAEARLKAQMDIEEKVSMVKWVVDNTGSVESTRLQVRELFMELKKRAEQPEDRLALDEFERWEKLYVKDSEKLGERGERP